MILCIIPVNEEPRLEGAGKGLILSLSPVPKEIKRSRARRTLFLWKKSSSSREPSRLLPSPSLHLPRGGCGGCVPFPRGSQGSCCRPTPGVVSCPGARGGRGARAACAVTVQRVATSERHSCAGLRPPAWGDTHSPRPCPGLP